MTRKTPIHHKVRTHNRRNAHVQKYERGKGDKKETPKRRTLPSFTKKRKINSKGAKHLRFNPWPDKIEEGEILDYREKKSEKGDFFDFTPEKSTKTKPESEGNPLDYWPKEEKVKEEKKEKEEKTEAFDFWAKEEIVEDEPDPLKSDEPKKEKEEKTEPFDMWGKEEEEAEPFDMHGPEGKEEDKLDMSIPDEEQFPKDKPEKPDIPYYSPNALEKMFLGDDEATARETAEDLGFTFEEERMEGHMGEKVLEFRYPIDTDGVPGIQEPDAYREIDLTIDLSTEKVTNVHAYMSNAPNTRWGKTETEY